MSGVGPKYCQWGGVLACLFSHVLCRLIFRDKHERMTKYSETRLALFGAVVEEFVAQTTATLATQDLENSWAF